MTIGEWLQLDDETLTHKLGEVLTPKNEWKHDYKFVKHTGFRCKKCKSQRGTESCPIPNPITLDWNTGIEYYRAMGPQLVEIYLHRIWERLVENPPDTKFLGCEVIDYEMWKDENAQPKHYLIAAAISMEKSHE